MLRKILSVSLVLILAATGLDLAAGDSQAAPHGGGHFGGGFHGGSHFGGFHPGFQGSSRPGILQGRPRDFGRDAFRPSIRRFDSPRRNFDTLGGWPYSGSYDPYDSMYPDYSDYSDGYGADVGGLGDDSGLGSSAGLDNSPGATSVPSASPQDGPADVSMTLPADATLWAQGQKMVGSGATREFHSPTLKAGNRYTYDFRATWTENGRTVSQHQTVTVSAGRHVQVHFPMQEKAHSEPSQASGSAGRATP